MFFTAKNAAVFSCPSPHALCISYWYDVSVQMRACSMKAEHKAGFHVTRQPSTGDCTRFSGRRGHSSALFGNEKSPVTAGIGGAKTLGSESQEARINVLKTPESLSHSHHTSALSRGTRRNQIYIINLTQITNAVKILFSNVKQKFRQSLKMHVAEV